MCTDNIHFHDKIRKVPLKVLKYIYIYIFFFFFFFFVELSAVAEKFSRDSKTSSNQPE